MSIEINREDFEQALPVATTKNNDVFEMVEMYIQDETYGIVSRILGSVGLKALEDAENKKRLLQLVKSIVCYRAFLSNIHSLDVVLTATGFGVVSTQDMAPASKTRVDALKAQLSMQLLLQENQLTELMFGVDGWSEQPLRFHLVMSLFWRFSHLEQYAGYVNIVNDKGRVVSYNTPYNTDRGALTVDDWINAQSLIMECDALIRERIGHRQVNELVSKMCSNSLSGAELRTVELIRRMIGQHIVGNKRGERNVYLQLMNEIEQNLGDFKFYAESQAYQSNHFKGYENTKESGMFFFQG